MCLYLYKMIVRWCRFMYLFSLFFPVATSNVGFGPDCAYVRHSIRTRGCIDEDFLVADAGLEGEGHDRQDRQGPAEDQQPHRRRTEEALIRRIRTCKKNRILQYNLFIVLNSILSLNKHFSYCNHHIWLTILKMTAFLSFYRFLNGISLG